MVTRRNVLIAGLSGSALLAVFPAGCNSVLIKRTNVHGLNNHPQHWSITWDNVWKA